MLTRTELAQHAVNAKHNDATHLFIARSRADRDHYYPVLVQPGTDPHEIIRTSRDPLVYCIALQHSNLPLRDQLTEHRPWHPEPAPGLSADELAQLAPPNPADRRTNVAPFVGVTADADARFALRLLTMANARPASEAARPPQVVTVDQLKAAQRNVEAARSWTFSPTNSTANYSHYEQARGRLSTLTHAAYEQGRIGPYNVHRITGLRREDVAPVPPATRASSRQPPLGVSAVVGY
jgi:hypothetical protein